MTTLPSRSPLSGHLPEPSARVRNAVIGFLGATVVMGWIGNALWATLIDSHPLVLIGLNATPKYLILTTNELDWWSYYAVGAVRSVMTKPFMWLLGAWYGERALGWAASRSNLAATVIRWLQARFGKLGWFVVPFVSSNPVCLLAGSTGMALLPFVLLASLGTLSRLYLYRAFGSTFSGPLDDFTTLVTNNRVLIVVLSVAAVVGIALTQRKRGRGGIDDLTDLSRDLSQDRAGDGS